MRRTATTRRLKTMAKTAKAFGTPRLSIQKSGGAQSVARKKDKRNGLMIEDAACIPATTMTNEAAIINMIKTLENFISI